MLNRRDALICTMRQKLITLLCILPLLLSCQKPENGYVAPKPPVDNGDSSSGGGGEDPVTPDPPVVTPDGGYIVVGYAYADSGPLPDPSLLTHINFSFAKIDSDFETLTIREKKARRLEQIVGLKKQKPELKVMLSVGGWGAGNFSEMAADETHRKTVSTWTGSIRPAHRPASAPPRRIPGTSPCCSRTFGKPWAAANSSPWPRRPAESTWTGPAPSSTWTS